MIEILKADLNVDGGQRTTNLLVSVIEILKADLNPKDMKKFRLYKGFHGPDPGGNLPFYANGRFLGSNMSKNKARISRTSF